MVREFGDSVDILSSISICSRAHLKILSIAILHYEYNLKKHINAYLPKSKKFCFTRRNLHKILRKSTEIVSSTWFPFNTKECKQRNQLTLKNLDLYVTARTFGTLKTIGKGMRISKVFFSFSWFLSWHSLVSSALNCSF